MKKNDPARHGFTLIEVLLAAMIVAMMGGTLYATFAAGFKLDHRIKQTFLDLDDSRIIIEQLHRDLGRAVNYDFRGSLPEQKAFFDNDEALIFVIDDGQQLRWVRYQIVADQKGQVNSTQLGSTTAKNIAVSNISTKERTLLTLVRDEGDFSQLLLIEQVLAPDKSEVLTKRIADKGWENFYAPTVTSQAKTEWRKEWKENYLPGAFRVSFSLQNEKGQIKKITSDFLLPAGGRDET